MRKLKELLNRGNEPCQKQETKAAKKQSSKQWFVDVLGLDYRSTLSNLLIWHLISFVASMAGSHHASSVIVWLGFDLDKKRRKDSSAGGKVRLLN